uniref:Uncharacterized protein n=1 Tax=viral metagenome TaxID=1070528 RepID=A0A6H2A4F7_9ZZZZ
MNKHEYQERMRKIKWMARHKKEKFGKKEMGIAQEMALAMMPKHSPKTNEPTGIAGILKGMINGTSADR